MHGCFLYNFLSICSITCEKMMFRKQCWRSDSSLGILGFSWKRSLPLSVYLQPGFCVPHATVCWGPVGEGGSEKWVQWTKACVAPYIHFFSPWQLLLYESAVDSFCTVPWILKQSETYLPFPYGNSDAGKIKGEIGIREGCEWKIPLDLETYFFATQQFRTEEL